MHRRFAVVVAAIAAVSVGGMRPASAQEFQVHTYVTGNQTSPAVATTPDGRFVVVWASAGQDGSAYGIFGQRFDWRGNPRGAEFAVNTYTTSDQRDPAVAVAADGSFLVVWSSLGQDGDNTGIYGQRYDDLGTPLGSEFRVNTYTTSGEDFPAVTSTGSGFVVVWPSAVTGVSGQRYDSAGLALGAEFTVNTYTTGGAFNASVSAAADGSFVVAWANNNHPGDDVRGVYARRFDPAGSPLGGEIAVNVYTTGTQTQSSVAVAPDGRFVVAWSSDGQDGDDFGVFGRVFDAGGIPQGTVFRVNAYTTARQANPTVSMAESGNFVVVFDSNGEDQSNYAMVARRYDSSGTPQVPEFVVNTFTLGNQRFGSVASAANGRSVVAWSSEQDADFTAGIYARRLNPGDLIFADGLETGDMSAWSSASTDGTDLSVAVGAALDGTGQGLQAVVDDTNSLFVRDDSPAAEARYRARFYLDPNGFDPGETSGHQRVRVLLAQDSLDNRLVTIVLKRLGGQFSVMARVRLKDGSRTDTPFTDITDAPHAIEFDWQRAGSVDTADGTFELFIDGTSVATLSALDDGDSSVDYVRMGVFSVKSGASGTLFLDEFVSHRRTLIGP